MRYQKTLKSIAQVLMICILNLYVFCSLPGTTVLAQTPNPKVATGLLNIFGTRDVLLNGNKVSDGATVLSGGEIQVQDSGSAAVTLDRLGRLDVGCRSAVRLTFTMGQIEVTVLSGYARLVTNQGVTGTLIAPDGQAFKTDPALATSAVATTTPNPCGPLGIPTVGGAAGAGVAGAGTAGATGLFGLGALATAALIGGGVVAAAAIAYAVTGGTECNNLTAQTVSNVTPCNP